MANDRDRSGYDDVTEGLKKLDAPTASARGGVSFIIFMLVLTVLFAGLGTWQVLRLQEKETLIARVTERLDEAPIALPPADAWDSLVPEGWDFRPVAITGRFMHEKTVLVFTSLSAPNGEFGGAGYWVVAPFSISDGGIVFVNRGFVPERMAGSFAEGGAGETEQVEIVGIARTSEQANSFTPGADFADMREWVRNIERLQVITGLENERVAPIYVDQSSNTTASLPQAGETRVSFPNRHLEYALTWFSLAVITPIMSAIWLARRRRERLAPEKGTQ